MGVQEVPMEDRLDQACAWIARLRSDNANGSDRREFAAWMAESADNRLAFERMSELWGDLGALANLPLDELFPESCPPQSKSTLTRASCVTDKPKTRRPQVAAGWNFAQWLMGGGLAAACLMMTLWVGHQWLEKENFQQQVYATKVGETRTVTLSDGSQVQLNTNTELRVAFRRDERHTELLRGEAFFDVARQTARPFTVAAGKANIRVLGTEFNVEHNAKNTRVSVTGGIVTVSEAEAASGLQAESVKLSKNQKVSVSSSGLGQVSATSADQTLDWTRGVLVFDRTPLIEALEELNRYLQTPAAADATVGERTLSGTFELSDPENTLKAIATALDLQEDHSNPNLTLLSPKHN